ncbi:MAG: 50S ribosomal protein L10 [Candidatus Omnitrophica bacterium]|nr:50S ribosomal protein L10 [Candidatus Omnitrophota bacterium]
MTIDKYGKKARQLMVDEMRTVITKNKGFVFSSVQNIKASDMDGFRKKMKQSGSRYFILKKRLAKIALNESGLSELSNMTELEKPLGMSVIKDDPVNIIKMMMEFAKQHKGFVVEGGYFDGMVLDSDKVKRLSELPGREQLIAMVLRAMNGPASSFVGVLAATLRSFMHAVNAIKEKKQGNN